MVKGRGDEPEVTLGGVETPAGTDPAAPAVPMRHLEAEVQRAVLVDDVVRAVVADLLALPDAARVAVALSEGGGRRLRFTSAGAGRAVPNDLDWCLIDAYDDVPLNDVVRTGRPILAAVSTLEERWPWLAEQEGEAGHVAVAVVPLLGADARLGGLYLLYDRAQDFGPTQREQLEGLARRTSAALHEISARRAERPAQGSREEVLDGDPAVGATARTASLRLPAEPTAPREARAFLASQLRSWGLADDVVDTAQLCLSEVVTNAVHHARTVSDLRFSVERGVLTVTVRDYGAGAHVVAPVDDEDPMVVFGRGLMIVEAMTDRWGSEHDAGGTTVWFALDLAPHATP